MKRERERERNEDRQQEKKIKEMSAFFCFEKNK